MSPQRKYHIVTINDQNPGYPILVPELFHSRSGGQGRHLYEQVLEEKKY